MSASPKRVDKRPPKKKKLFMTGAKSELEECLHIDYSVFYHQKSTAYTVKRQRWAIKKYRYLIWECDYFRRNHSNQIKLNLEFVSLKETNNLC